MSFKIAYCAGHHLGNSKGVPNYMGLGSIREWTINDQVARHFAEAAKQYENVELLRTDDPTGKTLIDIPKRCAAANEWGANIYIDMHHNGGIQGGTGGGVVAFSYPGSVEGREYRDAIYDAIITAGGLKGNRAEPKQEKAWQTLKCTKMTAILMEYGFMDSKVDAPIIITDAYSKLVAYATMEGIAKVAGLVKKPVVKEEKKYTLTQFIKDVQSVTGSEVDGIAGPETIGNTVTISNKVNAEHPVIKFVQKRLAELGYTEVGEADGIAGPKFNKAMRAFQKNNHCWIDGEATKSKKTWKKLLGME